MAKFKVYDVDFSTVKASSKGTVTTNLSAKLDLDCDFNESCMLSNIADFRDDFRKIMREAQKATRDDRWFSVQVTVATYDRTGSGPEAFKSVEFYAWCFGGYNSIDSDGVYLSPDVRYTDRSHDMYIEFKGDPFRQLADQIYR